MNDTTGGRFNADYMARVMEKIVRQLGGDATDAILMRSTNNAVFALPSSGMVIRIARSTQFHDRVEKVALLGGWFADVDAPTIRLIRDLEQPVVLDGMAATIWEYLPPLEPSPTVKDLAASLTEFHHLNPPPFALPRWDPVDDARRRIRDAEGLSDEEREVLTAWCDRLDPRIAALRDSSPNTLIHGDAHVRNVLRSQSGRMVLCDFDATCLGPWQADLAAVAVGEIRFNRRGVHQRLAEAYGFDVMTDASWPLLREARELKMIAAAVPQLQGAAGVAEEFRLRLRSAVNGDDSVRWTPFADLPGPAARPEST